MTDVTREKARLDVSICIPTRNRAPRLERTLSHLAKFRSFSFEVIVGDNGSTDNTREIVALHEKNFPCLTYHKHKADIGFSNNVDSIVRMARAKYVYVLSDDDILFENAMGVMKKILDANPNTVAVAGKYTASWNQTVGLNPVIGNIAHATIPRGGFKTLAMHIMQLCDGHPMMRRETFQRHCSYMDECLGLTPLFAQLLNIGDVCFIDQPVFEHFHNPDSLSTKLPEHWYQDFWASDIELAVASAPETLPAETLEAARLSVLPVTYFQAARMCRARGNYLLMWHYMRRKKAVGADDWLLWCERDFLVAVTLHRLCQIIRNAGVGSVLMEDTALLAAAKKQMQLLAEDVEWITTGDAAKPSQSTLILTEKFRPAAAETHPSSTTIAFYDLVETLRLTNRKIRLVVTQDRIAAEFLDPAVTASFANPSAAHNLFMSDYT